MIKPVYRYWLGTRLPQFNTKYFHNTEIDKDGQEADKPGINVSYELYVDNVKRIYINAHRVSHYSFTIIHCYTRRKYLGPVQVLDYDEVHTYDLLKGTEYIRLEFPESDTYIKNMITAGKPFIYSIYESQPHYKGLKKKYAKETGQQFFRVSLEGRITFFGDDYEIVKTSNIETIFAFFIEKWDSSIKHFTEYYKGIFTKADCKIDYSRKRIEPKFTTLDEYTDIMNVYETKYDLIKAEPALTEVSLCKRMLIQIYDEGADRITNFLGGTYWENEVTEPKQGQTQLIGEEYFAYICSACEIRIEGLSIEDANGVYAGIYDFTKLTSRTWRNNKGYSLGFEAISTASGNKNAFVYLYRDTDSKKLYASTGLVTVAWPYSDASGVSGYIEEAFTLKAIDGTETLAVEVPIFYKLFGRIICDVDSITDADGIVHATHDLPLDDFAATRGNYKKCVGFASANIFCTSATVEEPTRFGMNDYKQYFTNNFLQSIVRPYILLPINRNTWANASLWFAYSDGYAKLEKSARAYYNIKDCIGIGDAISALLKKECPSIKHEQNADFSEFLYGTNSGIKENWKVVITPKSNILKGDYDQAAQKAETSLKGLMDMLADCFKCYWFIENGMLKIEHISFFNNGNSYTGDIKTQINLTDKKDQMNNKPALYFQNAISFDKTNLTSHYTFGWMDDTTDLFSGITLDVNSVYIEKDKSEEVAISDFTSDIDLMLLSPNDFSSDGFALMCTIADDKSENSVPIVEQELVNTDGDIYKAIVQNWYASWPYLVRLYAYDMPAASVKCNVLQSYDVKSVIKCMGHDIDMFSENDPPVFKVIITDVGPGVIDEMTISLETRKASISLKYSPE